MVAISVRSNAKAFSGFLTRFERRQLPFAMSQALTSTAFDVRRVVVERTFPEAFAQRNKGFARAVMRVDKAGKRDLMARVFDRKGYDYLPRHDDGGVKLPRGRSIAVPVGARRTGRGVAKADQPRQVLASPKGFETKTGIFRKTGRGGKKPKLLFVKTPRARIRPRLDFTEDATAETLRRFDANFAKALNRALRTAK